MRCHDYCSFILVLPRTEMRRLCREFAAPAVMIAPLTPKASFGVSMGGIGKCEQAGGQYNIPFTCQLYA